MSILLSDTPKKYPDIFTGSVEGYFYAYNPISSRGVIVLDPATEFVFSKINNRTSINRIFSDAKKVDSFVTERDVIEIINSLVKSQLIYLNVRKYRLKTVENRIKIVDPKLLRVWIHLSNQCNLRCIYCFVHKTPERMDINLGIKSIKKIISSAKKDGYEEIVCTFGGGEPLSEVANMKKLIEIGRAEASKSHILLRFGIVSNATLITPKVAQFLKDEDIFVAVSMDGVGEYHDRQRPLAGGGASFNMVKRGIDVLKNAGLRFNTTAVITSKNISHLPEITKYFLDEDIPFIYALYKDNPNSQEDITAKDSDLIKYFRLAFDEIYKKPPKYSLLGGLLDLIILNAPHIHPCRSGRHYLVLKHDGTIAFCPVKIDIPTGDLLSPGGIKSKIKKGSILTPSDRSVNDVGICSKCVWKYACCGGCPLITKLYKNTYNSNSPLCHVFQSLIPDLLRIEAKRLITQANLLT